MLLNIRTRKKPGTAPAKKNIPTRPNFSWLGPITFHYCTLFLIGILLTIINWTFSPGNAYPQTKIGSFTERTAEKWESRNVQRGKIRFMHEGKECECEQVGNNAKYTIAKTCLSDGKTMVCCVFENGVWKAIVSDGKIESSGFAKNSGGSSCECPKIFTGNGWIAVANTIGIRVIIEGNEYWVNEGFAHQITDIILDKKTGNLIIMKGTWKSASFIPGFMPPKGFEIRYNHTRNDTI